MSAITAEHALDRNTGYILWLSENNITTRCRLLARNQAEMVGGLVTGARIVQRADPNENPFSPEWELSVWVQFPWTHNSR